MNKHAEQLEELQAHEREMMRRYSRSRNFEFLILVSLIGTFLYDRDVAAYTLLITVIWLLLTNRNSFYTDWKHAEKIIDLAEQDYKHYSHLISEHAKNEE